MEINIKMKFRYKQQYTKRIAFNFLPTRKPPFHIYWQYRKKKNVPKPMIEALEKGSKNNLDAHTDHVGKKFVTHVCLNEC